jgi:hypothetical protein
VGASLFFAADDGWSGVELFASPLGVLRAVHVERYGRGCAGTGGRVPAIGPAGLPTIGNAAFGVRLTNGLPSSPAALFLSVSRVAIPLGGGCTLLVDPQVPFGTQTDPFGNAFVPQPVPNVAALMGVSIFFQGLVADPNGSWLGVGAWTDGLQAVLGS